MKEGKVPKIFNDVESAILSNYKIEDNKFYEFELGHPSSNYSIRYFKKGDTLSKQEKYYLKQKFIYEYKLINK